MENEKMMLKHVRLSYAQVFEPRSFEGGDPKYSTVLLISKDDADTVKKVQETILRVAKAQWGDKIKNNRLPSNFNNPLKDGDDVCDVQPAYENCFYLRASSKRQPVLLDRSKRHVEEEDNLIYSGCYCNASINIFAFDASVNKGISAGLNGLQFVEHGERLGGGSCENDFDQLDEDEFDDEGIL